VTLDGMDTIDANKTLARRFLDLVAAHDVEELCRLVTDDWTMRGGPPNLPTGPDGIRALFASFGEIEQTWTVEDVIAEGDRVVVRATNTCLMDSFLGVPARGRPQTFTATFVHRVVDGRVAATWRNADDLGRLLQLGATIQPPG
jgi:predicted ester cyclase